MKRNVAHNDFPILPVYRKKLAALKSGKTREKSKKMIVTKKWLPCMSRYYREKHQKFFPFIFFAKKRHFLLEKHDFGMFRIGKQTVRGLARAQNLPLNGSIDWSSLEEQLEFSEFYLHTIQK